MKANGLFLVRRFKLMKPEEEMILKTAKEVVIKYIEIGRLPLTGFDEAFRSIYKTIQETVRPEK
jgi:hypothetical protein